LTELTR
jgi:hypothetical protein